MGISARGRNLLTALTIKSALRDGAPDGRHPDGQGLYLEISKGSAWWLLRATAGGRRREMGLGSAHDVTLAQAREKADDYRRMIANGLDPIREKRAAKAAAIRESGVPTFGEAADAYVEAHEASFKNEKHVAQWRMTLTDYCEPIRSKPVNEVNFDDVVRVLKPLWQKVPETASRLRGRIERVLDAAKVQGYRSGENPAAWRGNLEHMLPKPKKLSRGHHKAMAFQEVASFMARLDRKSSRALAMEFVILTALRSQEALGAKWSEIDLEAKTFTVPGGPNGRMKVKKAGGRDHVVPLSDRAIEVLEAAKVLFPESELVFPGGKRGKPLTGMALPMLLRDLKVDVTVHGYRSSFRDWAAETTGFANEVVEMALAHEIGNKVEAAYRRGDLLEKRRELMQAWSNYVSGKSNVSQLRRAS